MTQITRSMKFLRKFQRRFILGFITLCFTAAGFSLWAGWEIASPSRRHLMTYHRQFLANPSARGIDCHSFTGSDGTPVLVCTPNGKLGERGKILRQQLTERGFLLKPAGEVSGTLVLLHGRKGRKEDYLPIAERLSAIGFRCIIPDLPAHGDHPSPLATYGIREATLPEKILEEVAVQFHFNPHPAGLLGMSMGGSVAMHAANRPEAPWQALVIISSFDSFSPIIKGQVSRYLGRTLGSIETIAVARTYQWKSGISLEEIQPYQHAKALQLPTLVAHGDSDRVIPISAGRHLFDSLPASTPKKWITIPKADHDNVLITRYPIYADIGEWVLQHVK